ncbi:iron-siderophore ABC transporter substrate-binding protein [Paeniglutamicibacter kerguelensis]|uniref:Iron complex transport system substrate-binding protein n=1 Tax=Paeniglutamicibacter kerguelensis TaxID=254788 RepID=A0ABS4XAZ3_9MICC|nr:iron-siderophore ABC transporter substrate-binding protein [Paeniglutamicibacter kerguelensis]MBP2385648.1 iron complex transport system substrate-binding protein [Paeniglutamicibacter kerguelensis]
MKSLHRPLLALIAAGALALTGCGTTEEPASGSSSAAPSASGAPVSVIDARGKTVTLDAPATRLVGTEWNVLENMASLGTMPVGAADVKGYNAWVQAAKLDDSVKDIGTRGEPSIDTVAALDADVIVATTDLPEAAVAQLEKLAPVVVLKSADASNQIGQAIANLNTVAALTGTQAKATEITSGYESALAAGRTALETAGLKGTRVAFADGWVADGAVSIRPFAKGSLITDINTELGLVTPWELEGDEAYGLASTDVEGMTKVDAEHFVYITNSADGDFTDELKSNAIWNSLAFVKAGNVHRLEDGIWMFGGPASMTQYVNAIVASLTK